MLCMSMQLYSSHIIYNIQLYFAVSLMMTAERLVIEHIYSP